MFLNPTLITKCVEDSLSSFKFQTLTRSWSGNRLERTTTININFTWLIQLPLWLYLIDQVNVTWTYYMTWLRWWPVSPGNVWWYRSVSTLAQIVAFCLTTLNLILNQCLFGLSGWCICARLFARKWDLRCAGIIKTKLCRGYFEIHFLVVWRNSTEVWSYVSVDKMSLLVQVMSWHRQGDRSLPGPILASPIHWCLYTYSGLDKGPVSRFNITMSSG